jgi:predicted GNAT family acetyltransferase
VGVADYRERPDRVVFTHTDVVAEYEGHGVANALIGAAVADVVASGKRITPLCAYVADYLSRHPEFAGSVTPDGSS